SGSPRSCACRVPSWQSRRTDASHVVVGSPGRSGNVLVRLLPTAGAKNEEATMETKPSKFWAFVAVIVGLFLLLSGIAAVVGYLTLPAWLPFQDALAYELGNIAALYLGLVGGVLAIYHGIGSIANHKSSLFKLPAFYLFWIILALVLGLG